MGHVPVTLHTTTGAGGNFKFSVTDTMTYQIVISRDGIDFDPATPTNAVLTGIASTGDYTVSWNGRDSSGNLFPASGTGYSFVVKGRAGEIHFPIVDAENNGDGTSKATATFGGGPTVTRLNGPSAGDRTVYFDDRGYITASGALVGNLNGNLCPNATPAGTNPNVSLLGVDSNLVYSSSTPSLYRWWVSGGNANTDCASSAGWGDAKGLNLWTYYVVPASVNTLFIDPVTHDGATSVTGPNIVTANSAVQGAFSFGNNGSAGISGVSYSMSIGTSCTAPTVTFGNLPTGVTVSCSNSGGRGVYTFANMPSTLAAGQFLVGGSSATAPMTYSFTAPAGGPVVVNTSISNTTQSPDDFPSNDTASLSIGVGTNDVQTTIGAPGSAVAGSTVSGTFQFANFGASAAGAWSYTVKVGSPGSCPGNVAFPTLPAGVTLNAYSTSTCLATFNGLPASLAAGQSFNFGYSYTAPSSGPVPVSTTVNASGDANAANNAASASTAILQPAAWQLTKAHSGSMTAGGTGSYTITVSNSGGNASAASTVTVSDTPPTGMTVTGMSGTGWTCAGTNCTRSDSLAAGASYPNITVAVSIASNAGTPLVNSTTVSGGGVASSATATDSTTIVSAPAFRIDKAATASAITGGTITYTVTLTNIGGSTSGTGATILDALPAGVSVTGVAPGSGVSTVNCANYTSPFTCSVTLSTGLAVSGTASFSYAATAPGTAGTVVNKISVDPGGGNSPQDPTQTCTPTTACASASTNVTAAALPAAWSITKTHSGNMTAGGTGSYTITVSNSGGSSTAASLVTVGDTPPTGMTITAMSGSNWTCGNNSGWACTRSDALASGANYEAITVTVSIAANAGTPLTNSTTVSGGGVTSSATANDPTVIVPPAAAFGIAKIATSSVAAGGSITYTITLTNIGGSTSGTSATVKDVLPAGVSVTAVNAGSGVSSLSCGTLPLSSNFTCTVGLSSALAVNGTASFSYTATAPSTTGRITNYIAVDPTGGSSVPADPSVGCVATGCASADTSVIGPDVYTTISGPASVTNGAIANLVLGFGNQGAVAAQGVSYQLTLPTTVSGVSCGGATCSFNATTGVLSITGLPTTLVPGQQLSVNVSYRAGGTAVNAVSLIATTSPGETPTVNNQASLQTTVSAAAASTQADPTTALRAPATAYPGNTVSVDVSFANLGADNAVGLAYVLSGFPVTGTPALSYNGIGCSWNQASGAVSGCGLPSTLPVGQSIALRASYTAPGSGSVTLTSTVSSTSPDANTGNNSATAITTVVAQPATPLADVTTTVSVPSQAYGGSTVLVPVSFQNLGPASAAGVGYALSLAAGAASAQITNNGVLCSYSGGSIGGCNLPTTLAVGQAVNLVLSFTAPAAPAAVTVTSTVSTITAESNANNNTATGSLSVPTLQPTGTISGRVWYDANRNRRYDTGEVGRASWSVDLLQGGSPIARTSTDANGQYSFTGLADGVYAVRFMPWMGSGTLPVNGESGTAITGGGIPGQSILDNIVIANVGTRNFRLKIGGDVVTEQSLPIDPSGTVYDSSTRQPISGATVTLGYACGAVDASWLAGNSTVTTGADGSYAFFLLPAAPSGCNYTLTVSKSGYTSPSTVIPSSGSWPAGGGAVTGVSGAPSGGQATTYYLSGPKPTTDVTNNNIPLDPQALVNGGSPASVPTLSTWAMLLLMTGMAALARPRIVRRRRTSGG